MSVDWSKANCAGTDPEMFYFHHKDIESAFEHIEGTPPSEYPTVDANLKRICNNCTIINECLEYALHHEEYGFWGGTSPTERTRMRKELDVTLEEVYSGEAFDNLVIELRKENEQLLEEELYGVH